MQVYSPIIRFVSLIMLIAFLIGCRGDRYEGGESPNGTIEERQKWGVEKLGNLYRKASAWVEASEVIRGDVGAVEAVVPIGNNRCGCAFTDGCSCFLFLEVFGTNGKGQIELRTAYVDALTRELYFAIALWDFNGQRVSMRADGKRL